MFRSLQKNWVIWMRLVTVTAAVMAILVSALAISPDVDHDVLPTQSTIVSLLDAGVADDGFAQPVADTNCHVGHSCSVAIMPGSELALTRFDSAPELPREPGHQPSGAGYVPFHPPRFLSQV